ncbi:MAG: hypothetical protein AABO58_19510 [Acidobacteriota bacterium]
MKDLADAAVRLLLLIGKNVPVPAPGPLIEALVSAEVRNHDNSRDGFQLTFTLGRTSAADYDLLASPLLDPPARVIVAVFMDGGLQVLIDGIITNHQVAPSNKAAEGSLVVTGEDISVQLDLEERRETYANQSDSDIVTTILGRYARFGIVPRVTPTSVRPQQNQIVPTQQGTDLAYVQELARRNGFVFYIETTPVPGATKAHWGRQDFTTAPQPALTMNMGVATNVESLNFSFNALGPATPMINILEPTTRLLIPVPVPSGLRPPLSRRQAESLRRTRPADTANLEPAQAAVAAAATATASADAVTASGQLDAVRYGHVLRARRLVAVRGVGDTYDGAYYVKEVTHRIKRGEYKQIVSLSREGRGTLTPLVVP